MIQGDRSDAKQENDSSTYFPPASYEANNDEWNDSMKGEFLWANTNFGEAVTEAMTPLTWSVIQFTLDDWIFIPGFPKVGNIGLRMLPSYLEANPRWFEQMRGRIQAERTGSGLFALWDHEIKGHIKQGVWCVLGSATHSADYTLHLRWQLTDLVGPDDANLLIATMSSDSDPLASLEVMLGLRKVARGEISKDRYLEQFGHRGPHEFELSVPRPAENPGWLERELAHFHASPIDIDGLLNEQRATFGAALQRLLARHPRSAQAVRRRLAESGRRARLRELARSEYTRDRWLIRLFALRASEITGLEDDIFFLTLDEVLEHLCGSKCANLSISGRKQAYFRYRSLPPYSSIIVGCFNPSEWASNPQTKDGIFYGQGAHKPLDSQDEEDRIIQGAPGSAGQVEGIVRRLESPEEGNELQKDEIMVAVQTDIAWTLLFPRAAAIVTDVGAPLSHAAIVARELGIPAVVGCGNAMDRLKNGDRVRVDGSRGTVEILK